MLARARSASGRGVKYQLGAGASYKAPTPGNSENECDCSGFVCWVLGVSRYQPQFAWLKKLNGGWMNTDGIWWDGTRENTGFFDRSSGTEMPGNVIVYPSLGTAKKLSSAAAKGPDIGHVGIVTAPGRVIHCSSGNFRKYGDSI